MHRYLVPAKPSTPTKTKEIPYDESPLRSFLTWNVNGLINRMRSPPDWKEFKALVTEKKPDIIGLQEVKLPAQGPTGCKKGDGAPRQRHMIKKNDATSTREANEVNAKWREDPFDNYDIIYSLSDWKYSGVALLIRKGRPFSLDRLSNDKIHPINFQYTSLSSGSSDPPVKRRKLDGLFGSQHHTEGRIIQADLPDGKGGFITILNLYTPNMGWGRSGILKRGPWEADLRNWCRSKISEGANLIVMGDLNVAPDDVDLSHPKWFKAQTMEKGCPEDHIGQPGCQPWEKRQFADLLAVGLHDRYRELHPLDESPDPEGNGYTWRGHGGSEGAGRYYNKGMRIDHCLTTEKVKVKEIKALSYGKDMVGSMGSDHSPVYFELDLNKPSRNDQTTKDEEKVVTVGWFEVVE